MRKLLLAAVICLAGYAALAQSHPNPDSIAYQNQRKKINNMLAQRAVKFSQYDQSLSKHTGIFGLQTKKDIRRSNDILMDITQTDNAILRETKVLLAFNTNLLNYRTYQQQTVQSHAKETEDVALGYMNVINKLRDQNQKLIAQEANAEKDAANTQKWLVVVIVLMAASILFLLLRKRPIKA